jgi:hypothetical protein
MKIFIDNTFEAPWGIVQWQKIMDCWKGSSLCVCGSIEEADAILIILTHPKMDYVKAIESIARSSKYRNVADKLFVFDHSDIPLGFFPGIYASLRRHLFSQKRHRTGCYLVWFNEFITYEPPNDDSEIRYLFSFQGEATATVRKKLFLTDFGRKDVLIERRRRYWGSDSEMMEFKRRYAEVIARSKFVLCPRGNGTSSVRLFETMQSGRVPVIISDAWVPCANIDWNKFSLRVREKDIAKLPNICLEATNDWVKMAVEARTTWEEWFSNRGLAKLIETSILEIKEARNCPERLLRYFDWPMRLMVVRGRRFAVRSYSAASSVMSRLIPNQTSQRKNPL